MNINIQELYGKYFPQLAAQYSLKSFQEKVIHHVSEKGSTVAVMPTGGGKSLIYWVAAKSLGGTCLVISPLIALIDEQALKLKEQGLDVIAFHTGISSKEQVKLLKDFANKERNPDFIFVSPERIATDGFFEYCITKRKDDIKLIVIDEIHCVSQWGFDFRPFYKRIPEFLSALYKTKWPPILGLTATINPKELHDISLDFNIPKESILKDDILLRFDIDIKVEKFATEDEKEKRLWNLLEENKEEKVLVYLYRKYHTRGVEDLSEKAEGSGFNATAFHGDMSGDERQGIIRAFKFGTKNIVFATNAFGMGIDIPDIRIIIHFMIPESVEQYYQEIGRGGRDQKGVTAYMLYTQKNVQVRKTHFINKSFPNADEVMSLFTKTTNNEVGIKTLQYFAEEDIQSILSYYLNSGAVTIDAKGFTNLKIFKSISDNILQNILDKSRTGMVIPVLNKSVLKPMTVKGFFEKFYEAVLMENAILQKNFDKCLIINSKIDKLSKSQLVTIEEEISIKRQYKHDLLDYLVYLLDSYNESKYLHQEIGRYLGVPKHLLGKIYKTESGDWVRSKSEVIISNILFRLGIKNIYEEKLYYNDTQWIEPDFTIEINGTTWYWEHLGLLGDDEYDERWAEKKEIYKALKIKTLIITKESAILSTIVNEKVESIRKNSV